MLNQLIILPTPEHLRLLDVLSVLVLLIHIPFIGLVIGTNFFSLFFDIKNRFEFSERTHRLGKEILTLVPRNIFIYIMLGIVPLVTLMLVSSEWFYQTSLQVVNYFGVIIASAIVGLFFLYLYNSRKLNQIKTSLVTLAIGGIGWISLINAYYILINTLSIFLFPEYWTILDTPVPLCFSWNPVARFHVFLFVCFAITGLSVLFFWFHWTKKGFEESYGKFVRNFGGYVSLVSVFLLPVVLIWDVMTRPGAAQSVFIFELYLLLILFLIFLGYRLFKVLAQPQLPIGGKPLVLFTFVLFLLLTTDELAKENANWGHVMILSDKADLIRAQLEDKRTAGAKVTPDPVFGEQVYKNRCSTCHAFDHKVVGPPHNEVLPKYKNDLDTLRKFVKNPWKVNPNLPQMPAQPLNKKELESVIVYMMKHIESEQKTQK